MAMAWRCNALELGYKKPANREDWSEAAGHLIISGFRSSLLRMGVFYFRDRLRHFPLALPSSTDRVKDGKSPHEYNFLFTRRSATGHRG